MEYMKLMIKKIVEHDLPSDDQKWLDSLDFASDKARESAKVISDYPVNDQLNEEIAKDIQCVWNDKTIQMVFKEWRAKICVPDSTAHYLNSLKRIIANDYIPTDEDLLLIRYRTTGMTEKKLVIEGNAFLFCDVGGQRNERRKWINFFDSVTAVIFVASLSCYDEAIYEDEDTNCMTESLHVFDETINLPTFKETAFILFLNKKDVFDEKITKVPITVCFKEYTGRQTSEESMSYIRDRFEELNPNPGERQLFPHITQATDRDNVKKVFHDVQHIVVQWSLEHSGLV